MGVSNVVCFVLHGLLVTAFPMGDYEYDGVDLGLLGVTMDGTAEFSGTAPALGYCSIVGQSPCPDLLPVSSPIVTPGNIVLESDDDITYDTENDEDLVPINTEYDESANGKIPNKVILGALIADAIMKEKGTEIDATLAELDAFVEAEIGSLGPLIQNAIANADTSEVDRCVDTALLEIESKIASELAMVDAFIDSELIRTENLVESVSDNADQVGSLFTLAQCLNETTEMENANMTEKEALIAMELAILESFVESQLAKVESIIDAELEKVNSFVESELAKVDGIVESELAKVDLFVETEMAKTDAHVKSELSKMESFVDAELEKLEPVEETDDVSNVPPTSSVTNDESLGYGDFDEEVLYEDVFEIPVVGEVFFSGVAPAEGSCKIFGVSPCDTSTFSSVNRGNMSPPMVGEASPFIRKQVTEPCNNGYTLPGYMQKTEPVEPQLKALPTVNFGGNVNFSGTARATGSTSLYAHFPCAPLTATEVGPDGKKYIWLSKKTPKNVPPPQSAPSRPRSDFPMYTEDFPETIIMDSTKNYEKLMSEDLNVDFGVIGPVAGDAFFEGTAPAFGSVSIRGHCA